MLTVFKYASKENIVSVIEDLSDIRYDTIRYDTIVCI